MEDEESLQPGAVISQLPDSVQDEVDDLLANRVVAPASSSYDMNCSNKSQKPRAHLA